MPKTMRPRQGNRPIRPGLPAAGLLACLALVLADDAFAEDDDCEADDPCAVPGYIEIGFGYADIRDSGDLTLENSYEGMLRFGGHNGRTAIDLELGFKRVGVQAGDDDLLIANAGFGVYFHPLDHRSVISPYVGVGLGTIWLGEGGGELFDDIVSDYFDDDDEYGAVIGHAEIGATLGLIGSVALAPAYRFSLSGPDGADRGAAITHSFRVGLRYTGESRSRSR